MFQRLLSGDYPRSKVLAGILVAIFVGLAFAPFLFPGVKALNVAAKVLVFVVLVASFDLLLGYTGIVSFAHTMFFGIGAYGIAVATTRMGPTWAALGVGIGGALLLSLLLSLVVGLFSLRVRAIFFAMITLAVAAAFQTLASQLSDITGGEDGLTFKVPEVLSPSFEPFDDPFLGVTVDGRLICYYLLFVAVFVVGSALAGLGGVMWGLYQQNVVPQMGAQVNVLIFIVIIIGGLGSTGGALIGALLVGLMANYTGFLAPKVALFSNIALMVAILLWRPQGVYPVTNR